jgi:hypothetical protein
MRPPSANAELLRRIVSADAGGAGVVGTGVPAAWEEDVFSVLAPHPPTRPAAITAAHATRALLDGDRCIGQI